MASTNGCEEGSEPSGAATAVTLSLNDDGPPIKSPRVRSKSLIFKPKMLVPEVGRASDVATGFDDMYIEGTSLRRGFASEFVAMLEVSPRHRVWAVFVPAGYSGSSVVDIPVLCCV